MLCFPFFDISKASLNKRSTNFFTAGILYSRFAVAATGIKISTNKLANAYFTSLTRFFSRNKCAHSYIKIK